MIFINPIGEISHAISLPLDKPFYLYSLVGAGCQHVKGATVKEEGVSFDEKDGRYHVSVMGENPFSTDKNEDHMKLTYCYYTPGKDSLFLIDGKIFYTLVIYFHF